MPSPGSYENEGKTNLWKSLKSAVFESTDLFILQNTPKAPQTVNELERTDYSRDAREGKLL
jgi:hypothetical protein